MFVVVCFVCVRETRPVILRIYQLCPSVSAASNWGYSLPVLQVNASSNMDINQVSDMLASMASPSGGYARAEI